MIGEVGFIHLRELCLSLPGFQETGNNLTLFCGVLMYQILKESVKKYGQYGQEIISVLKYSITKADFHESRTCWTTLI